MGWTYLTWLRGAELFKADLRGADLSGANLSAANLSNVNLSGAKLREGVYFGDQLYKGTELRNKLKSKGTLNVDLAII